MRIGMLSQFFDPEPGPARLPGALARELATRGHTVKVLTGFPNYPSGKIAKGYEQTWTHFEHIDGVHVQRVPLFPNHSASPVGRAANYLSFGASAAVRGAAFLDDVDALWVSNSPPTISWPMWRAMRRSGAPALLHVLDLWPDNVVSSELVRQKRVAGTVVKGLDRWTQAMYRSADHVAAISPGIVEMLTDRGVPREKLSYIPMWANESDFYQGAEPTERADQATPDDRVVVLYAGTIGRAQAIDSLVRAAALYSPEAPELDIWIAGSGVEEQELRVLAAAHRAGNVRLTFLGRVPSDRMAGLMASADLHFVGLRSDDNSRITMPSKVQATLACGRPMLIAVGGDAERVVLDAHAGLAASAGDPESIAQALATAAHIGREGLAAMGSNARDAYDREFSLRAGADRVEAVLSQIVKDR